MMSPVDIIENVRQKIAAYSFLCIFAHFNGEKGAGGKIKSLTVKTLTNVLILIASAKAIRFLSKKIFNQEEKCNNSCYDHY
jgi:hypothetical protein